MYVCAVVILALSGLPLVNSRDLQSMDDVPRILLHANTSVVQDNRDFSRCGKVGLRCFKPIFSYMDSDGKLCGWKNMSTFRTLPNACLGIQDISISLWGENVVKYKYKFIKTCGKIKTFQKCVRNNQVCRRDLTMKGVISEQNTFCDNLQVILPVITCMNAWDRSVNWAKLVYTDWRIVQACPATHYRQLALNSIKLFLFTYITHPSASSDGAVESVNAHATGRYICQYIQQSLCLAKRGDAVCQGYLPIVASQNYDYQVLMNSCNHYATSAGKCNAFVNMICPINYTSGHMTVKTDLADIRNVYNMTYWHAVSNSEVDILLSTDNKGIGHCDSRNLIFKQLGCFHQYITQIDMNYANHSNYLSKYMCSHIKQYNDCLTTYITSSCPDMAEQFQVIGSFLHSQCNILTVANRNVTCPLHAVYSDVMFSLETWFTPIMWLMEQYISVCKCNQMNPVSPAWRHAILLNSDMYIIDCKSLLIKAAKMFSAQNYEDDTISTVCDHEVADVYNDYVTLSTGEQYYKLLNYIIKGFEYITYLV